MLRTKQDKHQFPSIHLLNQIILSMHWLKLAHGFVFTSPLQEPWSDQSLEKLFHF